MNDLEKMNLMCQKNMDIKCSNNMVEARTAAGGGHVTMGVDKGTIVDICTSDDYYVVMYIVNKKQFDELP